MEKLSSDAGQTAPADPIESSEAEMMAHQFFQIRQKPLGLYISYPSVTGCAAPQREGKAAI